MGALAPSMVAVAESVACARGASGAPAPSSGVLVRLPIPVRYTTITEPAEAGWSAVRSVPAASVGIGPRGVVRLAGGDVSGDLAVVSGDSGVGAFEAGIGERNVDGGGGPHGGGRGEEGGCRYPDEQAVDIDHLQIGRASCR